MPEEGPPVEDHQSTETDRSVPDAERAPFPIVVVETPEQSADADASEQETREHEAADLQAQRDAANGAQRAAASAERQEVSTLALSIIGTIIAVIALWFSVLTARRADKTSRAQLRAYVLVEDVTMEDEGHPRFSAILRNSGETPALGVVFHFGITAPVEPPDAKVNDDQPTATADVGAGGTRTMDVLWEAFEGQHREDILTGKVNAWLYGVIQYRDVFGVEHFTWFRNKVSGERLAEDKFILTVTPTKDGNHIT